MCDCDLCKFNREVSAKIAELPEDKQEFFEALHNNFLEVDADLDYYKAIFDGSWPSAKEVLLAALKRTEEKP